MFRKTSIGKKSFNIVDELAHKSVIARFSVHVNARYNVRAEHATACYRSSMQEGWFERLLEAIKADPRSLNKLSEEANLGRNFVQQMIRNGKEPGSEKLSGLLALFSEQTAMYVLTGLHLDRESLHILDTISRLNTEDRRSAKHILERMAGQRSEPEQSPDQTAEDSSTLEPSK